MKFLNKIISWTLTYKFCKLIKETYYYIKDYNTIGETLYGDDFKNILKRYLNIDLEKDWLGRLYGVLNPNIDVDGHFNINNTILYIDGELTNNNDQLLHFQSFVFQQLDLIGKIFKLENMYNYITFKLEHVGPINADNYLLVFDIASRKSMANQFKKVLKMIIFYGIIAAGTLYFI